MNTGYEDIIQVCKLDQFLSEFKCEFKSKLICKSNFKCDYKFLIFEFKLEMSSEKNNRNKNESLRRTHDKYSGYDKSVTWAKTVVLLKYKQRNDHSAVSYFTY